MASTDVSMRRRRRRQRCEARRRRRRSPRPGGRSGRCWPSSRILLLIWYVAAIGLNAAQVIERTLSSQPGWGATDLIRLTLSMDRPVLPAPHQIALDLFDSLFGWPLDSPRNLLYPRGRHELGDVARLRDGHGARRAARGR